MQFEMNCACRCNEDACSLLPTDSNVAVRMRISELSKSKL